MNANTDFQLEIGLLFLVDSLAKIEIHIEAEYQIDIEKQTEEVEKIVKDNN
jgi:hypothetical protein